MTQAEPWISKQPIGDRPPLKVKWWGDAAPVFLLEEAVVDAGDAGMPEAPDEVPAG